MFLVREFNFVCRFRIVFYFGIIFYCIFGKFLFIEFYWYFFVLVLKLGDISVVLNFVCNLEKFVGIGSDLVKFLFRWYFDSKGLYMCELFFYSGSGGNENNFKIKVVCI